MLGLWRRWFEGRKIIREAQLAAVEAVAKSDPERSRIAEEVWREVAFGETHLGSLELGSPIIRAQAAELLVRRGQDLRQRAAACGRSADNPDWLAAVIVANWALTATNLYGRRSRAHVRAAVAFLVSHSLSEARVEEISSQVAYGDPRKAGLRDLTAV